MIYVFEHRNRARYIVFHHRVYIPGVESRCKPVFKVRFSIYGRKTRVGELTRCATA